MDVLKIKSIVLYVLASFDTVDLHKIFKILYFADQAHLVKYGTTITNDTYHAMDFGGVPSLIYDGFKIVRGDREPFLNLEVLNGSFEFVSTMDVKALSKPDLDELSESEIECLNLSIEENKPLTFQELVDKSHDMAWKDTRQDGPINVIQMAKAADASSEMLSYIKEVAENESIRF